MKKTIGLLLVLIMALTMVLASCEPKPCEHKWGEWTETTAATCTEKGSQTRKCTLCDETETAELAAKGHTGEGTCTVCGADLDPSDDNQTGGGDGTGDGSGDQTQDGKIETNLTATYNEYKAQILAAIEAAKEELYGAKIGLKYNDITITINDPDELEDCGTVVVDFSELYIGFDESEQLEGYGEGTIKATMANVPTGCQPVTSTLSVVMYVEDGMCYFNATGNTPGFGYTNSNAEDISFAADIEKLLDSEGLGEVEAQLLEIKAQYEKYEAMLPAIETWLEDSFLPTVVGFFESAEQGAETADEAGDVLGSELFADLELFDKTELDGGGYTLTLDFTNLATLVDTVADKKINELVDLLYGEGSFAILEENLPKILAYNVTDLIAFLESRGVDFDAMLTSLDGIALILSEGECLTIEDMLGMDKTIEEFLESPEVVGFTVEDAILALIDSLSNMSAPGGMGGVVMPDEGYNGEDTADGDAKLISAVDEEETPEIDIDAILTQVFTLCKENTLIDLILMNNSSDMTPEEYTEAYDGTVATIKESLGMMNSLVTYVETYDANEVLTKTECGVNIPVQPLSMTLAVKLTETADSTVIAINGTGSIAPDADAPDGTPATAVSVSGAITENALGTAANIEVMVGEEKYNLTATAAEVLGVKKYDAKLTTGDTDNTVVLAEISATVVGDNVNATIAAMGYNVTASLTSNELTGAVDAQITVTQGTTEMAKIVAALDADSLDVDITAMGMAIAIDAATAATGSTASLTVGAVGATDNMVEMSAVVDANGKTTYTFDVTIPESDITSMSGSVEFIPNYECTIDKTALAAIKTKLESATVTKEIIEGLNSNDYGYIFVPVMDGDELVAVMRYDVYAYLDWDYVDDGQGGFVQQYYLRCDLETREYDLTTAFGYGVQTGCLNELSIAFAATYTDNDYDFRIEEGITEDFVVPEGKALVDYLLAAIAANGVKPYYSHEDGETTFDFCYNTVTKESYYRSAHDYEYSEADSVESTECMTVGVDAYKCTLCGDVEKEYYTVDHDMKTVYTVDGNTVTFSSVCDTCGETTSTAGTLTLNTDLDITLDYTPDASYPFGWGGTTDFLAFTFTPAETANYAFNLTGEYIDRIAVGIFKSDDLASYWGTDEVYNGSHSSGRTYSAGTEYYFVLAIDDYDVYYSAESGKLFDLNFSFAYASNQ